MAETKEEAELRAVVLRAARALERVADCLEARDAPMRLVTREEWEKLTPAQRARSYVG